MTRPDEIIYCPDLTAMLDRATEYAAAGAQLDGIYYPAGGGMYQPEIIASAADTVVLRLHAMAGGTHHLRRTQAYTAAEEIIAAAQTAAEQSAQSASAPSSPAPAPLPPHKR